MRSGLQRTRAPSRWTSIERETVTALGVRAAQLAPSCEHLPESVGHGGAVAKARAGQGRAPLSVESSRTCTVVCVTRSHCLATGRIRTRYMPGSRQINVHNFQSQLWGDRPKRSQSGEQFNTIITRYSCIHGLAWLFGSTFLYNKCFKIRDTSATRPTVLPTHGHTSNVRRCK